MKVLDAVKQLNSNSNFKSIFLVCFILSCLGIMPFYYAVKPLSGGQTTYEAWGYVGVLICLIFAVLVSFVLFSYAITSLKNYMQTSGKAEFLPDWGRDFKEIIKTGLNISIGIILWVWSFVAISLLGAGIVGHLGKGVGGALGTIFIISLTIYLGVFAYNSFALQLNYCINLHPLSFLNFKRSSEIIKAGEGKKYFKTLMVFVFLNFVGTSLFNMSNQLGIVFLMLGIFACSYIQLLAVVLWGSYYVETAPVNEMLTDNN